MNPVINTLDILNTAQILRSEIRMDDLPHLRMTEYEYKNLIKKELAESLAAELVKSNCIEFTKFVDYNTHQNVYRARIAVLTKDNVSELRNGLDI